MSKTSKNAVLGECGETWLVYAVILCGRVASTDKEETLCAQLTNHDPLTARLEDTGRSCLSTDDGRLQPGSCTLKGAAMQSSFLKKTSRGM